MPNDVESKVVIKVTETDQRNTQHRSANLTKKAVERACERQTYLPNKQVE